MDDYEKIIDALRYGRQTQIESGNLNQWDENFPDPQIVKADIRSGSAYLCLDSDNHLLAVFSLLREVEPNYQEIEGQWLNNQSYVTIHRIASTGKEKGVGQYCLEWVQEQYDNIRIDTHEDNQAMQYLLRKLNFQPVGIIHLQNGDPRDAFHYVK